jgi:hypothetical protein
VTVELVNGCAYVFPPRPVQDLSEASPEDLAVIEVDGMGFNLRGHWLDADLYVPALVSGVFGTQGLDEEGSRASRRQPDLCDEGNGSSREWSQRWQAAQAGVMLILSWLGCCHVYRHLRNQLIFNRVSFAQTWLYVGDLLFSLLSSKIGDLSQLILACVTTRIFSRIINVM